MTRDTWSFRLGTLGTEAEHLAAQLAAVTGKKVTTTDYVREAVTRHNTWARRVVSATEIPGGDIIITGDEVIVGERTLGPGVYRIAGTTDLIHVGDTTDDT
ncbi:hypothetical protein ABT336_11915 [Micromonospora sp. NPDC000207]|uniref:hypothetical protein n=1 Tax=Micromonospora sp. NPDC000207 TaxID=3154246 RepID=UPI00332FD8C6